MASNDSLESKLREGIAAVQRGDKTTARRLLQQVTRADNNNELAWMWLASAVDSASERRACLQRVLEINPKNQRAQEALSRLGGRTTNRRQSTRDESQQSGGFNFLNILLGIIVAAAVIGVLFIFNAPGINDPEPTATIQVIVGQQPTVYIPPTPRSVVVTLGGDTGAPTLPPTFTPTATNTPTATYTPSATPFPLAEFEVLLTSRDEDRVAPDLFSMEADGENFTALGEDFRDVVVDPGGLRIAFVRDVEYPVEEGSEDPPIVAPELFIADLDDLENPTQVTQMQTDVIANPSWSPEGAELVFVSDLDGDLDIWYVTPDGGNLRNLTRNEDFSWTERDPAWSPVLGSRQVVFTSDFNAPGQTEIFMMEVTEPGDEVVYDRLTDAANDSYSPHWSFDGSMITFISTRRGDADVYTMTAEGSNETSITGSDGDAEDRSPVFTPDGRWVVFVSNREEERFQTYILSLDGSVLLRLTNSENTDIAVAMRPNRRATFG